MIAANTVKRPIRKRVWSAIVAALRIANASWVNRFLVAGGVVVAATAAYSVNTKDLFVASVLGTVLVIYFAVLVMLKNNFEVRLATRAQIDAINEATRLQIQTIKGEFQRTIGSLDRIVGELSRLSVAMTQVAEETKAVKVATTMQIERDLRAEQARIERLRPKIYASIVRAGLLAKFNLGRYHLVLQNLGPEATDLSITCSTFNLASRGMIPQTKQALVLRAGQPVRVDFGGILEVNGATEQVEMALELRDADKRLYRGHVTIPLRLKVGVLLDLVEAEA